MTWGVNDEQSWLGAGKTPLLFSGTATITPKPAYYAVLAAINGVTGVWQVQNGRSGILRPQGNMGLFNFGASSFDVSGRKLSIFPLAK